MTFAERLKEVREKAGMTQKDLADRSGYSQTWLSFIENGTKHPSLENISRFSVALNVDVKDLTSGYDFPSNKAYSFVLHYIISTIKKWNISKLKKLKEIVEATNNE